MRLFYGIFLAVLIAVAFWTKLAPTQVEANPEAEKPQETAPVQPPAAETPSTFTKDYEKAMKEVERKVVLIFTCENCPSCELLKRNLDQIDFNGFLVCTVDAKSQKELVEKYGVRRFPTSVMVDKGVETDRLKGFSKPKWEAWLAEHK